MCNLIQLASPFATIIAAGVAVYFTRQLGKGQLAVANRQADIASVRLQHDLFDRRFIVYEAARQFVISVVQNANATPEEINKFVRDTAHASFLFDTSITDYLEEIRGNAFALRNALLILADNNIQGQAHQRAVENDDALNQWFQAQPVVMKEKLKVFLALR